MIVTLRVALLATLIALGLGYPLSFWIVRAKPSKTRSFVIVAVTISFLISFLIRLYSWIVLLGYYGTINNLFSLLGMSRVILLYNEAAVTIALGQWGAVFAVLFLIGPLQNIDPTLEDAAKTLGSDPVRTFIRVTLPLSLPGVIGVFSALFAWNVASFVTPMIVGGGVVTLIANFIYERFMFTLNYPLGAAMAFVLLTYTLAIWYGVNYFTSKKMPARLTVGGR
ncbi:ABC transporter permease [Candidatus Hecatella orcuttiae]|jgi:putative spermidine/putrescine transport system permease protein|uniref:ABC transporter permease n=1 Tax=Candidatus Hecatella orcuttiae TaxID=1935119 RepID=UPI002867F2D3|nr:ABC transporter permease [Candidatus Hecatella orcuttiae]